MKKGIGFWLKVAAQLVLGIFMLFNLVFAVCEVIGGDWSGLGHAVPAVLALFLMWLAWVRPLIGGGLLVLVGVIAAVYFSGAAAGSGFALRTVLLMAGPALLGGLLSLAAGWLDRPGS